jgi:superfamily II DNA or RNA helicase
MRFTLRDYQNAAIQAAMQARREGFRRLLVCLPTGAGKTVIFSELCRLAKRKVLVLAHREELLFQARSKIELMTNNQVKVGIEQADSHCESDCKVVVASIRSLREDRLQALNEQFNFGLIIYDECHHAAAEDNMRVLKQVGAFDADWTGTLIGFTATPSRADGIGLEKVFETIVYDRNILDMIREGYLVPLRGYRINTDADLTNLLGEEEGQERVDIESRNALVARSIQELARDRRTIVFCVTVVHAINLARALNNLGIPTGVVYGDMPREERLATLKKFRTERYMCLTNVMVLTEGFDDPGVSCIAMARPTKSEGLYAQCVGRGARLAEGKEDCLVLDFVDLSDLSLVSLPSLVGLPRELNLEGELITEAVETYRQLPFDFPAFEMEAAEITLSDVKHRAQAFDPLTMELHPEVVAITTNGWFSLGQKGLGLHFWDHRENLCTATILKVQNKGRRKKYAVNIDDVEVATFSKIIDAVEAVDYEINRMGHIQRISARDDADWRLADAPEMVQRQLQTFRPPRRAENLSDALGYLLYAKHNPAVMGIEHSSEIERSLQSKGRGWPSPWKAGA